MPAIRHRCTYTYIHVRAFSSALPSFHPRRRSSSDLGISTDDVGTRVQAPAVSSSSRVHDTRHAAVSRVNNEARRRSTEARDLDRNAERRFPSRGFFSFPRGGKTNKDKPKDFPCGDGRRWDLRERGKARPAPK